MSTYTEAFQKELARLINEQQQQMMLAYYAQQYAPQRYYGDLDPFQAQVAQQAMYGDWSNFYDYRQRGYALGFVIV